MNVFPDRVIKTIEYSGDPQTIEDALTKVKQISDGILNLKRITTVKFLEINSNQLTIHQERIKSVTPNDISLFALFTNEILEANRLGWVFGDINYKNVIFDGTRFRMIDFEPFTKIIRHNRVEYRVTPPYLHPLDRVNAKVTAYSDRLGLIGLYLRLRFGLRKKQEIFSHHARTLHNIAVTEGKLLIEHLQNLDKMYA